MIKIPPCCWQFLLPANQVKKFLLAILLAKVVKNVKIPPLSPRLLECMLSLI
jgi:hypothetical protein